MSKPAQLMTELSARVSKHAQAVEHIVATLKFELLGEPTEVWLVRLEPSPSVTRVDSGDDAASDCLFRLGSDDFVALMTGKVTGQQLFFDGRLQVEGDLTLALKLRELTQILRG